MNLFRFFSRPRSAPAARERLQLLLAHERGGAGDLNLVAKLRDEILRAISKHMEFDPDKVTVTMERGANVSTLAVDIEIPFDAEKKAAEVAKSPLWEHGGDSGLLTMGCATFRGHRIWCSVVEG